MDYATPLLIALLALLFHRLLARALMNIVPALRKHADRSVHGRWQGKYFAFDGRQVRLYLVDDTIWIAAGDLARIMTPPASKTEILLLGAACGVIPGQHLQGMTSDGVMRLLRTRCASGPGARDMLRFRTWLEKEAMPNVRRLPASSA